MRTPSRRLVVAVGLSSLLVAASSAAQPAASPGDPTVAALRERALASGLALELVTSLTTEVGPRFAGSAGDRRAVEWGLAAMRRLGLDEVRAEPVTVPQWVRGESEGEILAPWPQPIELTALGGSVGTAEEGITAGVVGFPTLAALEAASEEQVRGKMVFLHARMEPRRDASSYGETVVIRGRGPSAAARKGAVALLIRSVGTGTHRFPHTGGTRYADDAPRIPAAALAIPDAETLERQLASGQPVRVRLRLTARVLPDAASANVVGEVRGGERPREVVLLACHLDSWDLGTGALDDGAGCAIVLAAARLIAESPRRPARTLRVVLYANEEFGLSGARAYAERHAEEIPNHVLAFEADLGAGPVWALAGRVAPGAVDALRGFLPDLAPLGIEWLEASAFGGADLIPLREQRVPLADLRLDGTHYFDYHHTADDTLDKVAPADLAQAVAAYTVLAWRVASSDVVFGPAPEPEPDD